MPFAVIAFAGCLTSLRYQAHAPWVGSIVTALIAGAVPLGVAMIARRSRRD